MPAQLATTSHRLLILLPQPSTTHRGFVIAAIMASMFMIAIEATIVSTAMPLIVAQLGGIEIYSWVFAAFLLAQTATTVVFGKLADLYGRKPVILAGIAIFLVGLLLGGFAWSMPSMIVFRLIQGAGAGAVQPVAMTIVADLYPVHERGRIQGHIASVWAFSAVVGPLAGGVIIHNLPWSWVFWMNIPVGLAAAACYLLFLRERVEHKSPSIDVAGAALFAVAIGALMFALGRLGGPHGNEVALAAAVFVAAAALFVLQERRARDPMVSFGLWRRRPIATANAVAALASVALMGITTFLPMYVQLVLQRSPMIAGFALSLMLLGWPTGATIAARTFHRVGLRKVLVRGSLFLPVGAACFVMLNPQSSPLLAGTGSALMGLGMGLSSVCCLVLIQETAGSAQRGSATASNLFSRNLGSTLGATLLGAVVNFGLTRGTGTDSVNADQLRRLIEAPGAGSGAAAPLVATLDSAMHLMFEAMLLVTVLMVVAAVLVPDLRLARAGTHAAKASAPSD